MQYKAKKRKHRALGQIPETVRERIKNIPENYSKPLFLLTLIDVFYCRMRYGAGVSDYFDYRFYSLNHIGRKSFATVRDQFKLYRDVNDHAYITRTSNKNEFYKYYGHLMGRKAVSITEETDDAVLSAFIDEAEASGISRLIFKPYNGGDGIGIFILDMKDPALKSVKALMQRYDQEIQAAIAKAPQAQKKFEGHRELDAEWVIENHPAVKKVHPASLNTLRLPTLNTDGERRILGAYIRFGRDGKPVDNISSGGLGAEIDLDSGVVVTPATDHNENVYIDHPTTGEAILGFRVPYWEEVKALAIEASGITPQLKYIVWDIAVTPTGPAIIEGNSLGGLALQQLPKHMGKRYLYKEVLDKV